MLDYPYFKDSYKMIAVDLSQQQILNANNILEQIRKFRAGKTRIHFILEGAKETELDFSQGTVKVL